MKGDSFFPGQMILFMGQAGVSQTCQAEKATVAAFSRALSFSLSSLLSFVACGSCSRFLAPLPISLGVTQAASVCPRLGGAGGAGDAGWGAAAAGYPQGVGRGAATPLFVASVSWQTPLSLSLQRWPSPDFQTSQTIPPAWRAAITS